MKRLLLISATSLLVSGVVLTLNWAGWWFTGSLSMQANAQEKLLNVASGMLVLMALLFRRQAHAPSVVESAAAVIIALFIMLAGSTLVWQALAQAGGQVATMHPAGFALVMAAALLNGIWGTVLVRTGQRYQAPAMLADGRHLQADVLGALVVIAATAAQMPWLERAIALAIGLILLWRAVQVLYQALAQAVGSPKAQLDG